MIQHILFKPPVHNQFQDRLRDDIKTINSSKKAFIPADKTRNIYEMDNEIHDKLYVENVMRTYRKSNQSTYNNINIEAKSIAKDLDIEDKVECLAKNAVFITLKDHKEDFVNNPKCRLINPAKPELGKVSKSLIETINNKVRKATKVNQWHNTDDVIKWFQNLTDKPNCTFIRYDIAEFYPSISKEWLLKSLQHARKFSTISEDNQGVIMHAPKSLLFTNKYYWVKKTGDPDFDGEF